MSENKYIRIIKTLINYPKYIKNLEVIFEIPFKENINLKLKNNIIISVQRRQFPNVIELLEDNWTINSTLKGDVYFQKENMKISVIQPLILKEDFSHYSNGLNLENKNILDIGGLYGETSIFFLLKCNAKLCYIYEPVKDNCEKIILNTKLNELTKRLFLFNKGVSYKDGSIILNSRYAPTTGGFGLPGEGFNYIMDVDSWNTILQRHLKDNIYLAKVDCEGGERFLTKASKELITCIPNWSIEVHSYDIEKEIKEMFISYGYKASLIEEVDKKTGVFVYTFRK